MKLEEVYEGKTVTIELGLAIYIMDYAAHVKYATGDAGLIGKPLMQGSGKDAAPIAMNLLIGVRVMKVTEDSVVVDMLTPGNNLSRIKVPDALIVAVTEIIAYQPELPTVTVFERQATPGSKIIL